MSDYRIITDIHFDDDYVQAKKDLIQALNSIRKLTTEQQVTLAKELVGAESVNNFIKIMQKSSETR